MIRIEFYYDNQELMLYYPSESQILYLPRIGEKVEIKNTLYKVVDIRHDMQLVQDIDRADMLQVIAIELIRRLQ